jgi:hypothetical protein
MEPGVQTVVIRAGAGTVKIEGAEGHKAKVNAEGKLEVTGAGGGGSGGEVEIKGAEGHLAKVNPEGKLETTATLTGEITVGKIEGEAASGAAVKGNPVLMGGSDGTDARSIRTDNEGHPEVKVQNEPTVKVGGEPTVKIKSEASAKEVSVQNEPNVKVANEPIVKVTGAEGHTAKVNAEGKLETTATLTGEITVGKIEGEAATGTSVKGNPVLSGGSDGVDARTFKTDNEGHQEVRVSNEPTVKVGGEPLVQLNKTAANKEVAVQNEPTVKVGNTPTVKLEGSEGHGAKVNAEGKLETTATLTGEITVGKIEGEAASGAAVKGNPVLMGGSDGVDARSLKTDNEGHLEAHVTNEATVKVGGEPTVKIVGAEGHTAKVNAEGKLETTGSGGGGSEEPKATKIVNTPAEVREFKFASAKKSEEILPENTSIKGRQIHNYGAGACWLGLGQAAAEGKDIFLDAGAVWDGMIGKVLWQGSVFGFEPTIVESEEAKLCIVQV